MIYDINCPRCRIKMQIWFSNGEEEERNIEELTKIFIVENQVVFDRLAEL